MKKILLSIVLILAFLSGHTQDKTGSISRGDTYTDISFNASDTVNESETYYVEVTCFQDFMQVQDVYVAIDSVSGAPKVTVTLQGKKFASSSYATIGTPIVWSGSTGDTSFIYTNTTPTRYRYYKVLFASTATNQQSLITDVQFKTWFTGGLISGATITDGTATITGGAASGLTTIAASGLMTLSGNTGITFTGTAITKGINFASTTPSFSDADNAWIAMGTWNDAISITSQTEHFVPLQINLKSGSSIAKDIAAARFRVNTDVSGGTANTLTNVNVLELRSKLEVNTGSAANLQASTEVSENITNTGDLLVGYFSLQGDGNITCSNHVNVLEATNTHTGTGVDNVAHFTENGTGGTLTNVLKVEGIAGTATNLAALVNTGATVTSGLDISGTLTNDIVLQNDETIDNATNGVINMVSANVRAATYNYADATAVAGTGDAITIDFVPNLTALVAGLRITFIAEAANTTATTLAVDGGTEKAIEEYNGVQSALDGNDIRSGQVVEIVYNGTAWVMVSPSGN